MIPTLDAFYNTRSAAPGCCLALTADILFTPVRYLFGGRHLHFTNETWWCQSDAGEICLVRGARIIVSERWQKPANKAARWACNFFAALVFIPCVIAGTILKLVAHCNILTAAPLQRRYRMAIRALAEQEVSEMDCKTLLQVSEAPAYIKTSESSVFLAYRIMGIVRAAETPLQEGETPQSVNNLGEAWQHARYMAVPANPVVFQVPQDQMKTAEEIANHGVDFAPIKLTPREVGCCTRVPELFHYLWA